MKVARVKINEMYFEKPKAYRYQLRGYSNIQLTIERSYKNEGLHKWWIFLIQAHDGVASVHGPFESVFEAVESINMEDLL